MNTYNYWLFLVVVILEKTQEMAWYIRSTKPLLEAIMNLLPTSPLWTLCLVLHELSERQLLCKLVGLRPRVADETFGVKLLGNLHRLFGSDL